MFEFDLERYHQEAQGLEEDIDMALGHDEVTQDINAIDGGLNRLSPHQIDKLIENQPNVDREVAENFLSSIEGHSRQAMVKCADRVYQKEQVNQETHQVICDGIDIASPVNEMENTMPGQEFEEQDMIMQHDTEPKLRKLTKNEIESLQIDEDPEKKEIIEDFFKEINKYNKDEAVEKLDNKAGEFDEQAFVQISEGIELASTDKPRELKGQGKTVEKKNTKTEKQIQDEKIKEEVNNIAKLKRQLGIKSSPEQERQAKRERERSQRKNKMKRSPYKKRYRQLEEEQISALIRQKRMTPTEQHVTEYFLWNELGKNQEESFKNKEQYRQEVEKYTEWTPKVEKAINQGIGKAYGKPKQQTFFENDKKNNLEKVKEQQKKTRKKTLEKKAPQKEKQQLQQMDMFEMTR